MAASWETTSLKPPVGSFGSGPPPTVHGSQTQESRNIALKTFVIFVIFLGAVALTVGVLSLLASQGVLPNGMNSIAKLAVLGVVNSSLMVAGGVLIFILGVAAWVCHLHKSRVRQL
jgi:hypothetical protein